MTGSVLVIGYGNPGRRDDGLGPRLAGDVEQAGLPGVTVMVDYQLNVEHAADVAGHDTVVFVDAAAGGPQAFFLRRLVPRASTAFTSHAMRPEAVLALARDTFGWEGSAYLLGMRGHAFDEFGERFTERGAAALASGRQLLLAALRRGGLDGAVTLPPTDDSVSSCQDAPPCATEDV